MSPQKTFPLHHPTSRTARHASLRKMTQAMVEQDSENQSVNGHMGKSVLAVMVLYRMHAEESPAYRSLQELRRSDERIASGLPLLLWDNSPVPQTAPASLYHETPYDYFCQDTRNPGLGAAYSEGLRMATKQRIPWLLLLDQDTEVTAGYLQELFRAVADAGPGVDALVPRLLQAGSPVSPLLPRQVGPPTVYHGPAGVFTGSDSRTKLQAFNSGACLRVSALQKIGGFDHRFPLDYLDHATFAALQRAGSLVFVLDAALSHSLSTNTGLRSTPAQRARQRSILSAERRFYRIYGSLLDRLLHPARLLRRAASELVNKRDLPAAWEIVRNLF